MPRVRIIVGYNDLATTRPSLAAEWHPTKNGRLTPQMVTKGTNLKVWWLGKCGHEWEAMINNRSSHNMGCPYCSNNRVLPGFNDLITVVPEASTWWDYEKNTTDPTRLLPGTDYKSWWKCPNGHSFQMRTADFSKRRSCPLCSGKRVIAGQNDLLTTLPDLYSEIHPTKNIGVDLSQVGRGSHEKLWWIGKCGHEWEAVVSDRVRGQGCPYCASKKVLPGFNDLASVRPEIAADWDYELNSPLTPEDVTYGSTEVVWWRCQFGHSWSAAVYSRSNGRGCPECAKGLQTSFAEQAIFYYVKGVFPDAINGDRHLGKELDIYIPSKKMAIEYDGYMWHNSESDTANDYEKNRLCASNGILLIRFREEGATPLEENDSLRIVPCRYKDEESLERALADFFISVGATVSVSFSRDRLKIIEQYSTARRNKSLAEMNPEVARQWHPTKNGDLLPENISYGSHLKVWWQCENGHEWQANICNRATKKIGCPYCSGRRTMPGENDLETEMPSLAKEWHPSKNGDLLPSQFRPGSNVKVWWLCPICGHEWQAQINSRSQGHGCPKCAAQNRGSRLDDIWGLGSLFKW